MAELERPAARIQQGNLPVEYIGVSTQAFWKRGSTASGLNQAAIRKYATALSTAMHSQPGSDGISM